VILEGFNHQKREGKKKEGKNQKISIIGFQSGAMNIRGLFLKLYTSHLFIARFG
jgi:hypothetical protein